MLQFLYKSTYLNKLLKLLLHILFINLKNLCDQKNLSLNKSLEGRIRQIDSTSRKNSTSDRYCL